MKNGWIWFVFSIVVFVILVASFAFVAPAILFCKSINVGEISVSISLLKNYIKFYSVISAILLVVSAIIGYRLYKLTVTTPTQKSQAKPDSVANETAEKENTAIAENVEMPGDNLAVMENQEQNPVK